MVNVLNTSRNIIGRNPFMVIPLLANQYLTPMLSMWLPVPHGEISNYLEVSYFLVIDCTIYGLSEIHFPSI